MDKGEGVQEVRGLVGRGHWGAAGSLGEDGRGVKLGWGQQENDGEVDHWEGGQ